jgi:hypothetical protein
MNENAAPSPLASNPQCSSCRYWQKVPDGSDLGRCRFSPPSAQNMLGHAVWPLTLITDWCGEYQQ